MADTQSSNSLTLHRPPAASLARTRIIWAMKPLGFLVLVLWILHPAIADRFDHAHTALLGFLFGAVYGLIVYGPALKQYIMLSQPTGRLQSNRVPEEYYWGRIENVMFDNSK